LWASALAGPSQRPAPPRDARALNPPLSVPGIGLALWSPKPLGGPGCLSMCHAWALPRGSSSSPSPSLWRVVSVLRDALSLLNTSANARLFEARGPGDPSCIRCAVVGTGGILNGSGMGATINRHDYVFRMNGAITAGFERDVGDRTSFYGFSTNTMMNALHNYAANGFQQPPRTPETRYLFLPDHDRDYLLLRAAVTRSPVDQGQDKGARPQQYFGEDLRAEKFKMLHPDFIRYLRNRFLLSETVRSLHWKVYRPSTGAVMLLAAMHVCDEVSAYGFLTPNYTAFSEHYYDRVPKSVSFYLNHDMLLELRLWQRLQRSGLLTLYTRG
uniref:alpha-N-acetylgalactosaminide alpha-2,6-sialyltransferase n=1 Tax=Crocodylus porosus TaxID=8502 RepID=A0A7M4FKR0_CROPO